jgi:hypothetical protein
MIDYGKLHVGLKVKKISGDYSFKGTIVSCFQKQSGVWRVVVEDDRGLLLIMNPATQLEVQE